MEALNEFIQVSGLVLSLSRSTAYFCNVLNYVKLVLLRVLPFDEWKLPVKYLGVPLVSTHLIYGDCKEIVEKLMRSFLWSQGDTGRGKSKVAWEVQFDLKVLLFSWCIPCNAFNDGKVTLVDDEGKPLEKVDSLCDHDSEDEVASVDNEMASFFASKKIYVGLPTVAASLDSFSSHSYL
uniref:Reverse transcriptase domain, reverse transcriptase zinc-binding domain protein n=1 Tax=Tanacetum cinerariifolium TaxID=118510 RepID=A0A6L2LGP5_TANCI|nr:reverse transcriptase domain, reverse transcriptase zinc-binding domain protein [Tanacetum cinerariifolium]